MSLYGSVISQTPMPYPKYFSVFADNTIYLADFHTGVHQSTDDGLTWSCVFESPDDWHIIQIIKVSTETHTDVFWALEQKNFDFHMRVYTVSKERTSGSLTCQSWCELNLPTDTFVSLSNCRLAYDGKTSVYMTDSVNRAVHVWSVKHRQYDCQLLSAQQLR